MTGISMQWRGPGALYRKTAKAGRTDTNRGKQGPRDRDTYREDQKQTDRKSPTYADTGNSGRAQTPVNAMFLRHFGIISLSGACSAFVSKLYVFLHLG